MQELQNLWNKVLEKMELMVSSVAYDLWIKTLEVLEYRNYETLVLSSISVSAKQLILKNHLTQLKDCVNDVFGEDVPIEILNPEEKVEYLKKNSPDINQQITEKQSEDKNMFNAKYTFDNFVVGKSNQVVYAASRAVAENPGRRFNPLFIYGGVGLGKTHLLHAIGNYIQKSSPELKIVYATCENFTNDFVESMRLKSVKENSIYDFREKYRSVDVLMIDDIQFISNKTGTQEEFFHTFNDLHQNFKQVIISSDRPPKEIATLEDRLRSRFQSGLIQDVQAPDFETRVAILQKKAQIEKYQIDDEVINFIAEKVDTNIREMEGLLQKVYFFANLQGKSSATIEDAKSAFNEELDEKIEDLTPEKIIDAVCKYFDVSKQDIIGKKKTKEIVEPRMIAIYLINELLGLPLVVIGKLFGNRDHTTIIHARDKITEQVKDNGKIKSFVSSIKQMLST